MSEAEHIETGPWVSPPTELADLVQALDWSATPLGPQSGWSDSLKLTLQIVLTSAFPMAVRWGPEFVLIYNDGYKPILGDKHPWALGKPARVAWSEVWHELEPLHASILYDQRPALFAQDLPLRIQRHAARWEDARFTVSYSPVPDPTAPTGVGGVLVTAIETTEAVASNARLKAEREHLANLFRQAPGFICVLEGPTHVFELANDSYNELVGRDDLVGRSVAEVLPEVEGQGFIDLLDRVYQSGEPFIGSAVPVTLTRKGKATHLFLDFIYQPIRDAQGVVTGIFVEGLDVTERTLAAERQRLLVNELNHRVKNSLATVQSITAQTLRSAPDLPTARAAIEDRILSMARAHDMLTRESWAGADLEEIVRGALEPFGRDEGAGLAVSGPRVRLSPRQALSLSLALHELATNASKYGALTAATGQVSVHWRLDAGRLQLTWQETGGPRVVPSARRGFGTRLLERGLAQELDGAVALTFDPEGVRCEIDMPLTQPGEAPL